WARAMGVQVFNLTPGIGANRDYVPESQPAFRPSQEILRDVFEYERRDPAGLNGAILLLHLGAQRSDKMFLLLDRLVEELLSRGYRPLRIDDLLGPETLWPVTVEH